MTFRSPEDALNSIGFSLPTVSGRSPAGLIDLDKLVREWLERNASADGKSIEEYVDQLALDEIGHRYETFPKLKVVLKNNPRDLDKLSSVSGETTGLGAGAQHYGEHYTHRELVELLKDPRAMGAVLALTGTLDRAPSLHYSRRISKFLQLANEIRPPARGGLGGTRTGLDPSQNLLIASVFLTALHPDKFVDYRENRWRELSKQIGIEDHFSDVTSGPEEERLHKVGEFAKEITETQTFKKYWGDQEHPLWTLAGICWAVKGSNATLGTATPMDLDKMIDEILKMDYELAIDRDVVSRIILHLLSGKDVVLVGAPGVGKTALAKRILHVVGREITGNEYVKAVATAEWTSRNIIGGVDIKGDFQKGKVTEAAEQKKWLLIDEFNRADINKAFGEMFLAIESHEIPLSEEQAKAYERVSIPPGQKKITIPKNFRMVCTMNDFDKNLLLTELSFGLITRFAFIDIEPDTDKEQESVKKQVLRRFIENDREVDEQDYDSCKEQIEAYFDFINEVRDVRMIGVRTSIDVITYFVSASKENPGEDWSHLDEALCDYLLPQIDRLRKDVIDKVKSAAESKLTDAKRFTKWLDDRLEELEKISGFLGS